MEEVVRGIGDVRVSRANRISWVNRVILDRDGRVGVGVGVSVGVRGRGGVLRGALCTSVLLEW